MHSPLHRQQHEPIRFISSTSINLIDFGRLSNPLSSAENIDQQHPQVMDGRVFIIKHFS
jgi:hypothetical protein